MTQPMNRSSKWHSCAWACALSLVTAPAAAQAKPEETRWVVVPVLADVTAVRAPAAQVNAFESTLAEVGQTVLGNSDAAQLFETNHSSEPVRLDEDEMSRLLRRVGEAARHLALGDLVLAQQDMEGVYALSGPARDFLNREAARGRKIFDNCLTAAYLWERGREHQRALKQMLDCSRSFPGFRPDGRAYPPELRELFDQATQRLSQMQTTTLLVQSSSRAGCGVRLNGIEVGKSPMSFSDVRSGMTRVQLECEPGVAGRIHEIELHPGDNHLQIDPEFDRVVSSAGGLTLWYANAAQRESRADTDSRTLARSLGATGIVELWIHQGPEGNYVTVRGLVGGRVRKGGDVHPSGSDYAPAEVARAIAELLRSDDKLPPSAAGAPAPSGDGFVAAQNGDQADSSSSASDRANLAIGVPLAVAGGAGLVAGWAYYASRQDLRRGIYPQGIKLSELDSFHNRGTAALVLTAVGASALTISDYFWLPEERGTPTWAWTIGGVGIALVGVGVGYAVLGEHCDILDSRVVCQNAATDPQFGPMLALNALPLLGVPLTYLLRDALGTRHAEVSASLDSHHAQLVLSGSFF